MIILNRELLDFLEVTEDHIVQIKLEANKMARSNGHTQCTLLKFVPNGQYRITKSIAEGMTSKISGKKMHVSYYTWRTTFQDSHHYIQEQCDIEMPTDLVIDIIGGMKILLNTAIL